MTIVISLPFTLALAAMLARALGSGSLIHNVQELWPDVPRDLGVIRNRFVLGMLGAVERWIYRSLTGSSQWAELRPNGRRERRPSGADIGDPELRGRQQSGTSSQGQSPLCGVECQRQAGGFVRR